MNNLHSKVMARYEAIRKEEEAAMKARRAEVYHRVPRIADLETKMSLNSLQVARVHIKAPEDAQGEIRRLKEANLNLRQEKMELLVSHDFPMDYMDLKHRCRKCGDTGYLGSKRCSCYNQILAAIVYEESDFHDMLNDHSFETFDEALFDDENLNPEYGRTSRQNIRENYRIAKAYVRDFPIHAENLYFYGPSGTGKTFLATAIAKALLMEGQVVVYRTSSQLMDDIKDVKFRDNHELEGLLAESDLLIIDDLGTEMVTQMSVSALYTLINTRLTRKKATIISTNCSNEELQKKYTPQILSRIAGEYQTLPFAGRDIRQIKKEREA